MCPRPRLCQPRELVWLRHSHLLSSFLIPSFQTLTNCPRFITLSEPLSFQPITNCQICKPFVLMTIQQCRGWGDELTTFRRFNKGSGRGERLTTARGRDRLRAKSGMPRFVLEAAPFLKKRGGTHGCNSHSLDPDPVVGRDRVRGQLHHSHVAAVSPQRLQETTGRRQGLGGAALGGG